MNKFKKMILPLSFLPPLLSLPLFISSCSNVPENSDDPSFLSQKVVKENFSSLWKNKTFITSDDLSEFRYISDDAFNDLDRDLEFVDISNIKISKNFNSIKWSRVKEIRFSDNSTDKKVFNNILFVKNESKSKWEANTLVDRNKVIDVLKFPTIEEAEKLEINEFYISDYFYDSFIFKNINKISFGEDNLAICRFGISSFENCNKLDENIVFNYESIYDESNEYYNYIKFYEKSFFNTNISSLEINIKNSNNVQMLDLNLNSHKSIILNDFSFSNNKNLINFSINDNDFNKTSFVSVHNNLLSKCEKLNTVNITSGELILYENIFESCINLNNISIKSETINTSLSNSYIFKNNYKNLNFSFLISDVMGSEIGANVFSDINVENNNLKLETYDKSFLENKGLSQEQYNGIIEIENNSKILTRDIVNKKMATDWQNKNSINNSDLSNYKYIRYNAFDYITRILEYVDISNLEIINDTNSIKWNKVNEIKLSNNNDSMKIINNILFYKYNNYWWASTITKRNEKIDSLNFPSISMMENSRYAICDEFYDPNLFSNISKISFNNPNEETPISIFGIKSFSQCQILDSNLIFNNSESSALNNDYFVFRREAFLNTNIANVQMNFDDGTKNIICGMNSFSLNKNLIEFNIDDKKANKLINVSLVNGFLSNCRNLVKFELNSNIVSFSPFLFKGSEKLSLININTNEISSIYNSAFAGSYENFCLYLSVKNISNDVIYEKAFADINAYDIFLILVKTTPSNNIDFKGLFDEQKECIKYI